MMEIYYYDKGLKKGLEKDLKRLKNKPLWIDIINMTHTDVDLIGDIFDLHPLTKEDLFGQNSRIKVEEFQKYLYCVFYGIKDNSKGFELIELDFVLGDNFIISNHTKDLGSDSELKKDTKRLEALFKKGPEFIMHRLLDKEIDNFFPNLEKLDDELEAIEEEVIKHPKAAQLAKIRNMKRKIVRVKRHVFQQREKISYIAKNEYSFIHKKARIYFRDIYDNSIRVSETIDNYRENISETFDAYMSSVNNNTNEVMKVLSIFAVIALPMTVISGIYGTNFINLPGSKGYYGFWVMIAVMVIFSLTMIHFFRKRGWF